MYAIKPFAASYLDAPHADYEQQRLHLLRKHGIDLEDSYGMSNGKKTKRMSRHDVEILMGGGDGPEGLFTWREKHRRKVFLPFPNYLASDFISSWLTRCEHFVLSMCSRINDLTERCGTNSYSKNSLVLGQAD